MEKPKTVDGFISSAPKKVQPKLQEPRVGKPMSEELAACCFCFEDVSRYQRVELIIVPTPGGDERQGLVCHRLCLVERIDSRVPLHPDIDTTED